MKLIKLPSGLTSRRKQMQQKTVKSYANFKQFVARRTWQVLGTLLLIGFLLILLVRFTQKPETSESVAEVTPRNVEVFVVGENLARESFPGIIENRTTLTLVAQSAGPVKNIHVKEGEKINKGQTLVQQSTSYSGGNVSAVQTQSAAKSAQIAKTAWEGTKQTVDLQRKQADLNSENADELRKIAEKSISDTRTAIDTAENSAEILEDQIEAELAGTADPTVLQGLYGQLFSFQSSLASLRSNVRNLEYTSDTDSASHQLNQVAKDLVYKSTQLQVETSQLQYELARLQLQASRIQESLTRVQSPQSGTVERILIKEGQYVSPGTPVAIISGSKEYVVEIALPGEVATLIDTLQPALLQVGDEWHPQPINAVSSVPTQNKLFEVLISLGEFQAPGISEGDTVEVKLPLLQAHSVEIANLIPLDSVFITSQESYIFLEVDQHAMKKPVELGGIHGNWIEVTSELFQGDKVILNRRIIDDEPVQSTPVFWEELIEERG